MLVIVSFGLVLLATILLIVGLLNDTVPLIIGSIAASVGAAIVLLVASRMARPKKDSAQSAPEPVALEAAGFFVCRASRESPVAGGLASCAFAARPLPVSRK